MMRRLGRRKPGAAAAVAAVVDTADGNPKLCSPYILLAAPSTKTAVVLFILRPIAQAEEATADSPTRRRLSLLPAPADAAGGATARAELARLLRHALARAKSGANPALRLVRAVRRLLLYAKRQAALDTAAALDFGDDDRADEAAAGRAAAAEEHTLNPGMSLAGSEAAFERGPEASASAETGPEEGSVLERAADLGGQEDGEGEEPETSKAGAGPSTAGRSEPGEQRGSDERAAAGASSEGLETRDSMPGTDAGSGPASRSGSQAGTSDPSRPWRGSEDPSADAEPDNPSAVVSLEGSIEGDPRGPVRRSSQPGEASQRMFRRDDVPAAGRDDEGEAGGGGAGGWARRAAGLWAGRDIDGMALATLATTVSWLLDVAPPARRA